MRVESAQISFSVGESGSKASVSKEDSSSLFQSKNLENVAIRKQESARVNDNVGKNYHRKLGQIEEIPVPLNGSEANRDNLLAQSFGAPSISSPNA